MNISVNHLKRYREIALLLWKHGRSDLVRQMGIDEALDPQALKPAGEGEATPDQLAADLEAMGPTYVKLGQVFSSRPDLLPEPYLKALARLQDKVKPFSFAEVEQIVTAELGVRISKAFTRFDRQPLAAASLGQVHLANYDREAQNLIALGANLKEFERIQVPQPVPDYSSRCLLTMDFVRGRKITAVGPLGRLEMHGAPLAEELFKAYLKQVLVDGLFHADPHPGNVFLTDDGRIALLDLGMVGHTTPGMQENLLKLLLAISEGNSDGAADLVIHMSETTEEFNQAEFRRRTGQLMASRQDQGLQQINVGKAMLDLTRNAADNGLFAPSELTLLGKTLLQLDEVGKILDPAFDPNAAIRRNVGELIARRLRKQATPGNLFSSLLEMKDFVGGLPSGSTGSWMRSPTRSWKSK